MKIYYCNNCDDTDLPCKLIVPNDGECPEWCPYDLEQTAECKLSSSTIDRDEKELRQ
jgi:hypothetical protein